MDIITDNELIARIESFIAAHDMKPSRFGLDAMGDGALIPGLKNGRSLSLKNAQRVLRFMAEYRSAPTTSAEAA
jgi:hypothetical protein